MRSRPAYTVSDEIGLRGTNLLGNVPRMQSRAQPQVECAERAEKGLTWEELYKSWQSNAREYPELSALPTFAEIQWPSGTYWVPARPTEAYSRDDRESAWVDWWPRAEVTDRAGALAKKTSYGSWSSAFPQLPDACRYTLHYLWAARQDPQLTAAVWLAATMIIWKSTREEGARWGPMSDVRERVHHLCIERMEKAMIGRWLHNCKYTLPEAFNRFVRPPRYMHELVEMAVANAVFIHNRWMLIRLCHEEAAADQHGPPATAS